MEINFPRGEKILFRFENTKSIYIESPPPPENRRLCGVYKWTNKLNGKSYIGSSVNLSKRLSNYYNYTFLSKLQHNMLIYKALLKHGHSNFSLEILEYCDKNTTIEKEQYYLDLIEPEYNVLPMAGSRLGSKHKQDTLNKFKNRKITSEHKTKLVKHLLSLTSSDEHKERARRQMLKINKAKGFNIEVFDIKTEETFTYFSIREAAKNLGCTHSSISYVIKVFKEKGIKNTLKGRYMIKTIGSENSKTSKNQKLGIQKLKGISVEIFDIETKKTSIYLSIRDAAKAIGCSPTSIRAVIKLYRKKGINRPIKKRYLINLKNSES